MHFIVNYSRKMIFLASIDIASTTEYLSNRKYMTVGGATSHQQHYNKLNIKRKVFLVRRRPRLRQRSLTISLTLNDKQSKSARS